MRLLLGHDLGQAADPSALCGVERIKLDKPIFRRRYRYVIRLLESYPLGMSYPDQVKRTCATLAHPALKGSRCAVDYTGVGRPVFDMLKDARPPVLLFPVLTTSGHKVTYDEITREIHVPKTEQVSLLQVLLQADLLNWHPKLGLAKALKEQLAKFRVKITKAKNETFGAESGSHDDLVSAVMLACYLGEHFGGGDPAGIVVPDAADGVVGTAPAGVFH
ncbi:MAG TPA: hypothetical protein VD866_12115 [Urbifossiella sp.]|nr:hypothetical protein [Urbifossiella sp.]